MHEASLVSGMLGMALEEVEKFNASRGPGEGKVVRIKEIALDIGLISCVEEQTLKDCFEIMSEGSLAEHAVLTVNRQPLQCQCEDCAKPFELHRRHFRCPFCGGEHITFSGGHGCILSKLDVDIEENTNGSA